MKQEWKKSLQDKGRTQPPAVLLVAAECAPLAKTGGLADVVGTLPRALAKLGMDARVILPYHRKIKERFAPRVQHLFDFTCALGWRQVYVGIEKLLLDGVTLYLVDNEEYFGDAIYRGGEREIEQYAFFCRAVADALPNLDFRPEILHCNDWHTALIPMLARTQYPGCMQERLQFLLTIHNLAFQGRTSFEYLKYLLKIPDRYYTPEFIELYGSASFLKAGCVFAHRINTVSPSYVEEIKTPYYGEGLDGILRARQEQLSGIVNGIDTRAFDPANDPQLPAAYDARNLSGKAVCKQSLQQTMGLTVNPDLPILAMVTRMTEQKGFDLVACAVDDIVNRYDVQVCILGSGDRRFEDRMRQAEEQHKGHVAVYIGYSDELAHQIYAGSDFYLMPSRFEPCGISQMIAMRYGTIPIVRETGGLRDTVVPYNEFEDTGTGFSFANYNAWEMRDIIGYALRCTADAKVKQGLMLRDMQQDFSFDTSALAYAELYLSLLPDASVPENPAAVPEKTEEPCLPFDSWPAVIRYDSRHPEYRTPYGALPAGHRLQLALDVISGPVQRVSVELTGENFSRIRPMQPDGAVPGRYVCRLMAPKMPGAYEFRFRAELPDRTLWLCPGKDGFTGEPGNTGTRPGFRLTVYRPDFQTPAWFRKSVLYQIFPDRFGITDAPSVQRGVAYHASLGQTPELHGSVEEPVRWQPRPGEEEYLPDDFYGGNFLGIEQQLPYLAGLGITCLYLNPIFEARSNHRYDTADYERPDPILGTEEDFQSLCRHAEKLGIRILLDGVFSHTGRDSRYFNADGHYPVEGACQSRDSRTYAWYDFKTWPGEYRCWWGIRDLPEVDEMNPDWQDYMVTGKDSIVRRWLRKGAAGWRLDVADELPDEALALIRQAAKEEKPDALILGEVWEDAVTKVSYGKRRNYALGTCLDSVMNYPLRDAILSFMNFRSDAEDLRDFLESQKMNYPKPLYYSLMNLVGSHDTDRIRTAMATDLVLRGLPRETQAGMKFPAENLQKAVAKVKLCMALQFALPGVPSVYYGDEQGMTGVNDPFNRQPFRMGCPELQQWVTDLAKMRKEKDALSSGEAEFASEGKDILIVKRTIVNGRDVFGAPARNSSVTITLNRRTLETTFS